MAYQSLCAVTMSHPVLMSFNVFCCKNGIKSGVQRMPDLCGMRWPCMRHRLQTGASAPGGRLRRPLQRQTHLRRLRRPHQSGGCAEALSCISNLSILQNSRQNTARQGKLKHTISGTHKRFYSSANWSKDSAHGRLPSDSWAEGQRKVHRAEHICSWHDSSMKVLVSLPSGK